LTQLLQSRPATDADAVQLCAFLNACSLTHQGIARYSPDDVVARLHQMDADPRLDSFVVSDADEIVGFANVWRDGDDEIKFFARTHPDARGRGVGGLLLARCDGRAAELLPEGRWTTTTWAADLAGPPLLREHGYGDVRHYLRMELESGAIRDDAPSWPPALECVPLSERPELDSALSDAWVAAFAGEWGSYTATEEAFWRERRDDKDESAYPFDQTLWFLACDGDEVIGFCLCELSTTETGAVGRVAEIGVVPARRGTGLGAALLDRGFRELRRRGAGRIVLDVDAENVTTAIRLYTSAGMTPQPAFTVWEKTAAAVR
jgi:mycothiol synthase